MRVRASACISACVCVADHITLLTLIFCTYCITSSFHNYHYVITQNLLNYEVDSDEEWEEEEPGESLSGPEVSFQLNL